MKRKIEDIDFGKIWTIQIVTNIILVFTILFNIRNIFGTSVAILAIIINVICVIIGIINIINIIKYLRA